MKQEIKKINNVNLENKNFSRRAFLGTLVASLATASLPGCCAFSPKKQSSTSNQNEQAQNQLEQGQSRRMMGENITQEDIDELNKNLKRTKKQRDAEIEKDMEEARKQQELYLQQQEQLKAQGNLQNPNTIQQRPQMNTQPDAQATNDRDLPQQKHQKGKVWKPQNKTKENNDPKKKQKGKVWKGNNKDAIENSSDDTLEC